MPLINLIEAIRSALEEELERDANVVILGQDVGKSGGVFRATDGLFDRFGDARVMDTPLAESGTVGAAIGMALNGSRPIVEIQFADFIFGAMDQIVTEAARFYYRTNGEWPVPMVIRAPYGGPVQGGIYHSQSVEAFFSHVPGLKVVIPSTPYDAKGLLKAAVRDNNPVLFFEHKLSYRAIRGEVPQEDYMVPMGKAAVRREGQDLSIFAYGMMVHHSLRAAAEAAKEGTDVEVVDLRSLIPLDKETILASTEKTGKVLIAHEDNLTNGFGAEIAAIVAHEAFQYLDGPVYRVAAPDVPSFPYHADLERFCYPGTEKVLVAVRELAAY